MLSIEERKKLKSMLYHGAVKDIAAKAEISSQSVVAWFAGRVRSNDKAEKAALEILRQYKKETDKLKAGIL